MRVFKDKRKRKEHLYSIWTIGFLFVIGLLLLKGVVNIYLKDRESAELAKEANVRLAELENRHDALQKDTERLGTSEGIEEELRTKFGVVKPGEKVIVVVKPEVQATTSEELPAYRKVFDKIKSWF